MIFGYGMDEFPGRGLLEAVGGGVMFDDKDVLCIAHLFFAEPEVQGGPVLYKESWKKTKAEGFELEELYQAVMPFEAHGVRFRLHRLKANEGILAMQGDVSPFVSDSDPMAPGRPMGRIVPLEPNPEPGKAGRTAKALNEFLVHCRKVLAGHPVNRDRALKAQPPLNFLATQRCGRRIPAEPFIERWGMNGRIIASGAVFLGVASELGMSYRKVSDSGDSGTDLEQRISLALEDTLHEFIHVHTKAPDEAAHGGDPAEKAAVIEALDHGMRGLVKILEAGENVLAIVTADHSTPCGSPLIHSGESVPLLMCGPNVRRDRVTAFDEVSAAPGSLGLLRGSELMLTILNVSGRSALFGHRMGKKPRAYSTAQYAAFQELNGC
jgi:2,3-bisphosphoglycerate-independent phosphoglycerate mutase